MINRKTITNSRDELLAWIRSTLIGPGEAAQDVSEKLNLTGIQPVDRYHTAVLFPIVPGESGIDPASEDSDDVMVSVTDETLSEDSEEEPAFRTRRYVPPSSVGFSFYISGQAIRIQVRPWGVRYEKHGERDKVGKFVPREWTRIPLGNRDEESLNLKAPSARQATEERFPVYKGKGEIHIVWRPYANGWLTTIAFCNKQELTEILSAKEYVLARNVTSIFEAELNCVIDSGEVGIYPKIDRLLLSDEEQELELQYRERRIYAIGHGAAVDWIASNGEISELKSNFFPAVEVPQVTADVVKDGTGVLNISLLAEYSESNVELSNLLDEFVSDYAAWIEKLQDNQGGIDADEVATARRITERMETAASRMKSGIQTLKSDAAAAQAFGMANRAMLNQMERYDQCLGKPARTYRWRPFQLAFLLLSIESVVDEDSDYRDLVDLIWFPTGGGKTEAYLGLIAFLVVWRRLKFPSSSSGTSVLMRYTLRLLTTQQFERATRLICALELIRRDAPSLLGHEPITVGMWVGEASTPNTFHGASESVKIASQMSDEPPRSLILGNCPWCHTPFKASENFIATENRFQIRCTNIECGFGQSGTGVIPCNIVDEALFENPPTMLIATVDKFARLAWDERTSAFFGGDSNRPPELIIQDELHLISGALGSISGLYEAALDTVLIQKGVRPKLIASTATIRMADQQVKRLYGRELAVFPPPGVSCDDSYFARTVPTSERPGRLYVGFLAPMKNRQNCMAPLAAALLAAPEIVFPEGHIDREELLDAWWTQVVYHGSLKGVGNSHNSFNIEVPGYYRRLRQEAEEIELESGQSGQKKSEDKKSRLRPELTQLTSLSSPEENKKTFERLEKRRDERDYIDAVLATNMISAGLDVSRLALMIVNGQPLMTAEYIQASSRVGRSDVPGIVFVNYYRDQARSLSHYEHFRPYHESFYRFVEPTSITPYTYQARMRALHAAITIVVRHSCPHLLRNNSAGSFDPTQPVVAEAIRKLIYRCSLADPERASETKEHIELLTLQWKTFSDRCLSDKRQLNYSAKDNDKTSERLLFNHEDSIKGVWPTLQSMRNVEASALMKLL
mgnify:CR=1 FL=1